MPNIGQGCPNLGHAILVKILNKIFIKSIKKYKNLPPDLVLDVRLVLLYGAHGNLEKIHLGKLKFFFVWTEGGG